MKFSFRCSQTDPLKSAPVSFWGRGQTKCPVAAQQNEFQDMVTSPAGSIAFIPSTNPYLFKYGRVYSPFWKSCKSGSCVALGHPAHFREAEVAHNYKVTLLGSSSSYQDGFFRIIFAPINLRLSYIHDSRSHFQLKWLGQRGEEENKMPLSFMNGLNMATQWLQYLGQDNSLDPKNPFHYWWWCLLLLRRLLAVWRVLVCRTYLA